MPSSEGTAHSLLLLLADMHLGVGPLEEAEVPPLQADELAALLRLSEPARRFFRNKCASHDATILERLPGYIRWLVVSEQKRGYLGKGQVDFCLLLGDQATWPHPEAYSFLLQYLTQFQLQSNTRAGLLISPGLNLRPDSLLSVAGNHDKLLRRNLDGYHAAVSERLGLPAVPGPNSVAFIRRKIGLWEWLFIIVDANEYCTFDYNLSDPLLEFRRHLAGGVVTHQQAETVREGLETLKRGGRVGHVVLDDYGSAVKALVLHYAASRWTVSGFWSFDEIVLRHTCRDVGRLFHAAQGEIDIVFHGHLHRPKVYRHRGIPVISGATVSQRQNTDNGFYLLRCIQEGSIRTVKAVHHKWATTAFVEDPARSATLELRPSSVAMAAI